MTLNDLLPIPKLEACRRLLCIQPHPDDNEFGAGATIAKLAKAGCEVVYLTVTDGRIGTSDPAVKPADLADRRRLESIQAAGLVGVRDCRFLGIHDGSYPNEETLCRKIVAVIRDVQPDMVLTCDPFLPYEAHPDHRRVGMAALEACFFSYNPHFAADPVTSSSLWTVPAVAMHTTAAPNTFVDVGQTWELKFKALAAHESQFPGNALDMVRVYFEYKAAEYGAAHGMVKAEAFKVLTPTHLHSVVDTIAL